MLRRFVCAAVVMVIGLGVVMADEFQATILKVDNGKVTFKKGGKKGGGEETTLPVTKDAKIMKGKFNADTKKLEPDTAIDNGLKNEMFTNIKIEDGKGGVAATITTDADNKNITAITT